MKKAILCAISTLALAVASSASAQDAEQTISTDRPSFSAGSSTVATGSLQLEAGLGFATAPGISAGGGASQSGYTSLGGPNLLARYGLVDFAELRVGAPNIVYNTGEGYEETVLGSASLGFKAGTSLAKGFDVGFLGSAAIGLEEGDGSVNATATADVGVTDWLAFTANAGLTQPFDGDASFAASALAAVGLTDTVGSYVEWYAVIPGDVVQFADLGFTFLAASNLQFDVYGGLQLTEGESYFGGVGVSTVF